MRTVFYCDRNWKFSGREIALQGARGHGEAYNFSKAGGAPGPASPDYDDADWQVKHLPHDAMSETEFSEDALVSHGYKKRDSYWYRRKFNLPQQFAGKQITLCFDGTAVEAQIYCNGSLAARSFSAYCETVVDLTDRAVFGDACNTIAVHVNGLATEGWWYEGTGIYRHVRMFIKEPLHIAHNGLWICPTPEEDGSYTVTLETTLENSAYTEGCGTLKAEILDGTGCVVQATIPVQCQADGRAVYTQKLHIPGAHLWDVEDPYLYQMRVSVTAQDGATDEETQNFGCRTFTADPKRGFLLNGRPLYLKGTCNHQDHAGVGCAVPDAVQDFRIRKLKEMGANCYRCAHHMPARELLDACDRHGMLVMDENRRFETSEDVMRQLETLVLRDRNHPCVVIYSIMNEEPLQGCAEGARIYRRMAARVRKLDATRLITGALSGGFLAWDGVAAEEDVIGVNYNLHAVEPLHTMYPEKLIFGAESNSAVATRGCYRTDREAHVLADYDEETVPWGQTAHQTQKFWKEHPYFGGIMIWTGFDYRGEPTPFTWPSIGSQFGLMDTCGFPKDAYYAQKAAFTGAPMVHVFPHWNHKAGETVKVKAYSNCEEVELFVNGVSQGRKPVERGNAPTWEVCYAPGELRAKAFRDGICLAQDSKKTAGEPAKLQLVADRTSLHADGRDTVPVDVFVTDAAGVVVPDAAQKVQFMIEGDGVVLGVGNGDPNSHESDHAMARSAFHGCLQALVQALPGAKALSIRAEAEGLVPATVTFSLTAPCTDAPADLPAAEDTTLGGWKMTIQPLPTPPCEDTVLADHDMNTMEAVKFNIYYQPQFQKGWRLYETRATLPKAKKLALQIARLHAAQIRIFVDGVCIAEDVAPALDASYRVLFDAPETPSACIRIAILAKEDGFDNGIQTAVYLASLE